MLNQNLAVSGSVRKIVNELAELGWLFKKVNDWLTVNVQATAEDSVN